jgi:predicted RNase H-like HicB family nuclease
MDKFVFTGVIFQDDSDYLALCPELDVISQGETLAEAREMLLEAASLYLETAFESGIPYFRPTPPEDDPRFASPESVLEVFRLNVDVGVRVYA